MLFKKLLKNAQLNSDKSIHILSDVENKLSSLSISNIASKINERKSKSIKIFNLTIGDFNHWGFDSPLLAERYYNVLHL